MCGVLLGLGGCRGRGGETEQRAEASRGGQRRPKLMGGRCGDHVVKNTCKSYNRDGGRGRRAESGDRGKRERTKVPKRAKGRGGQREKQGLSQVVHSAKQVFNKHTESKQSQSTVSKTEPDQLHHTHSLII